MAPIVKRSPLVTANARNAAATARLVLLAVAAGLFFGGLTTGLWWGRKTPPRLTASQLPPEDNSGSSSPAAPLAPTAERRTLPPRPYPTPSFETVAKDPSNSAASELPAHLTEEVMALRMERRFQADSGSTPEFRRVESTLREGMSHRQGMSLASLECHTNTCRAQARFSTAADDVRLTNQLFVNPETRVDLNNLAVIIPAKTTASDGSILSTMYFFTPTAEQPY